MAEKFGFLDAYQRNDLSIWQRTKPKMYSLFDEPHSSSCAKVSGENKPSDHSFVKRWFSKKKTHSP